MGILLKSQYTIKNSNGELAKSSSPTTPYIGPYLDTIFGAKFEGNSRLDQGELLVELQDEINQEEQPQIFYDTLKPDVEIQANLREPYPGKQIPTDKEREAKQFNRYFFLDKRGKYFIEVKQTEYSKQSEIDTVLYQPFQLIWSLQDHEINELRIKPLKKLGALNVDPYDYI
jgi:hypothetical protein